MALPRAASSSLSCYACSASIFRSIATSTTSSPLRASWTTSRPIRRTLTSSALRRDRNPNLPPPDTQPGFEFFESPNSPSVEQPDLPASTTTESTTTTSTTTESTTTASTTTESTTTASTASTSPDSPTPPQTSEPSTDPSIPWYLRPKHTSPHTPDPTHNAAILPPLPPNPPPLLQTVLEYLSLTAGLDDLLLYDLRHLDPPPALGPKLIMLLCTARSEKHLHVSADRFCRYLRREYGLRANAAGLLGRNELKIKLRRKAKRMKMLANVGGSEQAQGNLDDGIRTGWICCTLGKIEAHPQDTDMPGLSKNEEFVGFRDVKPGVNVVVQMFTEEKRMEIDLESLWNGILRSHERLDGVVEDRLAELEEAEVEAEAQRERMVAEEKAKIEWARPKPSKGDVLPDF
ncbi:hypothetical protein M011DRAFT_195724 [Sporormia fimetaria CBS 119925]|uniref:ATPase synthesis protein 25 n=1 Tax=Sporormia fimetaria CBS 119925 TaxID=1340428 RepID=A0A6A6V1G7_9PLEO|nr:hypothetical protein M011DRAFT_195724 [Sporormia fimetaria CBS 119925]